MLLSSWFAASEPAALAIDPGYLRSAHRAPLVSDGRGSVCSGDRCLYLKERVLAHQVFFVNYCSQICLRQPTRLVIFQCPIGHYKYRLCLGFRRVSWRVREARRNKTAVFLPCRHHPPPLSPPVTSPPPKNRRIRSKVLGYAFCSFYIGRSDIRCFVGINSLRWKPTPHSSHLTIYIYP